MYMMPEPSSVHRALVTRVLGGVASVLRDPSADEMICSPIVLRRVSARWRLAFQSMNTPPSSSNGRPKMLIGTGPSPISSRNHLRSGLGLPSDTFISRGARTAAASSGGGIT